MKKYVNLFNLSQKVDFKTEVLSGLNEIYIRLSFISIYSQEKI